MPTNNSSSLLRATGVSVALLLRCDAPGGAPPPESSPATEGGTAGDDTADAAQGAAPQDAEVSSRADGSSSVGADGGAPAPVTEGGTGPSPVSSSADAGPPPVWATWPMPNAPTSGLPHPQSYDTSVAGVALDQVTGLSWQRDAYVLSTATEGDATTILEQAAVYCAGLGLGDYEEWRVPSRIELVSLLNFHVDPADDSAVFGTVAGFYVSSSVHASTGVSPGVGETWLGDGTLGTSSGIVTYAGLTSLPPGDAGELQGPTVVRCVHGQITASGDHYTITNGTVHDNWTGLTWIQSLSGSSMLPSTVSSYCASQTLDGGGWRAPSVNEVETLFGDYSSPDTVQMDPTAFPAGADIKIGTVDTFPSEGDGGAVQWMYVIDALTGIQEDVNYFIPLPGEEPASGYWVYAQCVR